MISKDHYVYVKKIAEKIMFLTLYVDDIMLVGNNMQMIKNTRQWLSFIFEMKNMGEAK